ncbi:bestrophin family protein [Devosia sp. 2618]|uniref:bestrophin family protein n=1 Tax=Devosia sp. 2618 TaxID=3156454 RepID=UPI00339A4BE5
MIVRPRPPLWQLFFILRGSVVPRIWPHFTVVFLLSGLIVWVHKAMPNVVPVFDGAPFTLLGIALSVFLAFRNNAAYERWWEARKVWGQLIQLCRTLARQTLLLSERPGPEGTVQRRDLLTLAIAFSHALVPHLRDGANSDKANRFLSPPEREFFESRDRSPSAILQLISQRLAVLHVAGTLSDIQFQLLDATIDQMEGVLAGCERIRNTPVPFGYTLLLHRTAYLFCFLLPLGYADMLGWATPFATALIAYTFFGLDALGDELEEPFGNEPNDLPIAAIADMIELNLRAALGETGLPPAPKPVNYLLT